MKNRKRLRVTAVIIELDLVRVAKEKVKMEIKEVFLLIKLLKDKIP